MPSTKDAGGGKAPASEWAELAESAGPRLEETDEPGASKTGEVSGEAAWELTEDQIKDVRSPSAPAATPAVEDEDEDTPERKHAEDGSESKKPLAAGEAAEASAETADDERAEVNEDEQAPPTGGGARGLFGRRGGLTKAEKRRLDRIAEQVAALSEALQTSATEQEQATAELRSAIEAAAERSSTELDSKATELSDSIAEARQEAQVAGSELREQLTGSEEAAEQAVSDLRSQVESNKLAAEQADAELGSKVAVFADETTADIGRQIDEFRSTIRAASEASRAELERFGADLETRIKDAKADIDASIESHGEQIGQIDDNVARIRSRLTDEAAALRKRVQTVEGATGGAKSDLQDLALRVERGLVDASERIASVADGLEQTLGEKVAGVQRSAAADNIALGKEINELRAAVQAAAAEFTTEGDDLESGLGELASKVRGIDSGFSTVLDRLDSILEERGKPRPPAAARDVPAGSVPLNSATFEEFRSIGLSVTQTARLIAYRDTHGGFTDLEQLREVRGLSSEDLRMLAERATL